MIFNAIYRLPIWNNLNKQDRSLRLFIVGMVLYIVLYFYLNSSYSDNLQMIKDYKDYIYYLISLDIILFVYTFYSDDSSKKKKKKKGLKRPNNRFLIPQRPLFIPQQSGPTRPTGQTGPVPQEDESVGIPLYEPNDDHESIDLPIYKN